MYDWTIPLCCPKCMVEWKCSQARQRPGKWKSDITLGHRRANCAFFLGQHEVTSEDGLNHLVGFAVVWVMRA